MIFKHPLARDAKVWSTAGLKGKARPVLVIITTLVLDEAHPKFKTEEFKRLCEAAKEWIGENTSTAVDYMLINRPKDWVNEEA